jgi:hypothetical protein
VLVPGATPVMVPLFKPTVTNVLLLLQVPPVTPELNPNVVDDVPHTVNVPEITGTALSVTTCVAEQPEPAAVYVIVLVPGATPVIVPLFKPTVTNVLLLLHVPPVTPALNPNVVDDVPHTVNVPVIAGTALSVTTWLAEQPMPGLVYVIVLVPGDTPTIDADASAVGPKVIEALLVLHVEVVTPPLMLAVNVVDAVPHTVNVPEIEGTILSVTTWLAVQPVPGVT